MFNGKHWQTLLKKLTPLRRPARAVHGQSMVEYVLIAVLVVLAIGSTIVLTKGSIGNIFSNTVYNLVQASTTPYATLDNGEINAYASAFAQYQRTPSPYITNTPAAPTCTSSNKYMVTSSAATGVWVTPSTGC